ncbi:MAG: polysaccharide biosynthesis/export family protein, partial [Planctomycetota bacterium]
MQPIRIPYFAVLALFASLSTSCSVTSPQEINEKYRDIIEQRRNHYRVKPGDVVTVSIYDREGDLSTQSISILPDGRGSPYFMPEFRFAGLTVTELRKAVAEGIKKEVSDPDFAVGVIPSGETVHLVGELGRPGTLELSTDMTLFDAIAQSQGIRITADSDYVILRRPTGNPPGTSEWFRIDVNDASEEIFLLPKDQIEVERNALATV